MRPLTLVGAPIVSATLALIFSSCAPLAHVGPPPDWVECAAQDTAAETTATVDYTGARLQLPRGHTLEVPPGAVDRDTPVTIRFRQVAHRGVRVQVEATPAVNLRAPATLTLSFQGRQCNVDGDGGDLAIYRVPAVGPPERLPVPPQVAPPEQGAAGMLERFSLFVIAR
jgi:hypothetical protein